MGESPNGLIRLHHLYSSRKIFERERLSRSCNRRMYLSASGASGGAAFPQCVPRQYKPLVLHSGGRYIERAIAANPGWHLLPDNEFTYPYGLKGSPIPQATLRQAFATNFFILLGKDDRRTTGIIRDNKQTRAQGADRYEHGHFISSGPLQSPGAAVHPLPDNFARSPEPGTKTKTWSRTRLRFQGR